MTAKKVRHRSVRLDGNRVSALCFKKPRPINPKRALRSIYDDYTTCKKCLAIIDALDAKRTP